MDHDSTAVPDESESDLVRRARRGDSAALGRLFGMHARAVHALAHRLTGDRAAAEDITQDTFLKMLRFMGGFHGSRPLRPWLKRVASNAAIDRLRRDWRYAAEWEDALQTDHPPAADAGLEAAELLRRLVPPARTVVWLHVMEGWTHPEIAARFGRTPSWSKSLLARSLAALRAHLEEENLEHP
jgi:RNA polymerase sigma-70 factor (ECF subfamily)